MIDINYKPRGKLPPLLAMSAVHWWNQHFGSLLPNPQRQSTV